MASLGKYTLIEQLGTGSMGTVYLARDTVLDREVALKTIRTGAAVEPETKERFYREARTCARLQHPSIITIFELGEADNFAYIAMELLAGSDFRKIIEARSPIDLAVKIEAIIQVCEALAYAHQQGIVHRDVKPSNLFLSQDNRAKVLDFGIARLPSSRLTVVGRVLGTPNYMAPEQILGKRSDGRSDLFSVAVVFFELLVGHHPFRSTLIPRRIVDGEPDSVFDHDSSVPLPFEKVFARGLSKDPDCRYATGNEFAADLRAILDGLRQNSSPRFSHFALPSLRAPVAAKPSSSPILNPSDSRDPEEWRLSEFLRVLPAFENAVERGDHANAERTLIELDSIGGDDMRFTESLRMCEAKILEISPVSPGPALFSATRADGLADDPVPGESFDHWLRSAVSATQPETTTSVLPTDSASRDQHDAICKGCGGRNRREASFCSDCGARMSRPDAPTPAVTPQINATAPQTTIASSRSGTGLKRVISTCGVVSDRAAGQVRRLWRDVSRNVPGVPRPKPKMLIVDTAIVVGLIIAGVWYISRTRTPLEPYVAVGEIQMPRTPLLRVLNDPKTRIASLAAGTRVDLLKQPSADGQAWLRVQPVVKEKALPSGFVKRDAVDDWKTARPDVALALARRQISLQNAGDADVLQQISVLHAVITRFPGTPEARTAAIEEANLLLELSRREQRAGQPEAEWRNRAQQARSLVAALPSDPQLAAIRHQADVMLGSDKPIDPGPSPTPDPADLADLRKARSLLSIYDYNSALRVLGDYLTRHPDDREARGLQIKVLDAKQTEEKTLH